MEIRRREAGSAGRSATRWIGGVAIVAFGAFLTLFELTPEFNRLPEPDAVEVKLEPLKDSDPPPRELNPDSEPREDLYLDARFGTHTYRQLLDGVEERFGIVGLILKRPRCSIGADRYDFDAAEECRPEELVKLGRLIELCDLIERDPPEDRLARGYEVLNELSNEFDHQGWHDTKDLVEADHRAMLDVAESCRRHGDRIRTFQPLSGLVEIGEAAPAWARAASYAEQAARLGYRGSVGDYAFAVNLLVTAYQIKRNANGEMSIQNWNHLLEQEAKAERFLLALTRRDPTRGFMELVWFEKLRLPADVAQAPASQAGYSDTQVADLYRRALVYYFAAESAANYPLRNTLHEYAGLSEADQHLDVNEIELARQEGFMLAQEYGDHGDLE